jgi:hypothetical protein
MLSKAAWRTGVETPLAAAETRRSDVWAAPTALREHLSPWEFSGNRLPRRIQPTAAEAVPGTLPPVRRDCAALTQSAVPAAAQGPCDHFFAFEFVIVASAKITTAGLQASV